MHPPKDRGGEAPRGTTAARGYGERHREWRRQVLARDPICKTCRVQPSTIADHVKPHQDGGARFDLTNGQGLCQTCHNRKTGRDVSRRSKGEGRVKSLERKRL